MANTHVRRGRGGGFRGGRGGGGRSWNDRQAGGAPPPLPPREAEDGANTAAISEGGYRDDFGDSAAVDRLEEIRQIDAMDLKMGFGRYSDGPERLGWLVNMHPTTVTDKDGSNSRAALDLYFLEDSGERFKATVLYEPYILLCCKENTEADIEDYLRRKFDRLIVKMTRIKKEDLDLSNHLLGIQRTVIKLQFANVRDLLSVRKALLPAVIRNKERRKGEEVYGDSLAANGTLVYEQNGEASKIASKLKGFSDALDNLEDIREYDVPYYVRVAIDLDFRVGLWYSCIADPLTDTMRISRRDDILHRAEPVVLAFDIETTKSPLKFPDAEIDCIMMISYMIDGQGYLITNREIVSEDINDFEYTPKPEYEGPFTVFNEESEKAVIMRFFEHISAARPTVIATYNGDFFDWPFVEARAKANGLDMFQEIGFKKDEQQGFYRSTYAIHMDCFCWVKRDSYLPQGSQGLKAVTSAKLSYNPMELDPEDMTRFASEQPHKLAQYSVSDAVATYYLYMKYVHPFVFSLCNIIPLNADDVLRKGSGTLCEMLLMVRAYKANVLMPNKHIDERGKTFEGHILASETYVGGHVEALEAGVFRSDLDTKFRIGVEQVDQLIAELDQALKFSIEVEAKTSIDQVANYDEVKEAILSRLQNLRETPNRLERPLIYHLDVAAMYPNIILTNRLQPDAIVDETVCASCDFNRPGSDCQREMTWSWRGEYYPAKRNEVNMIRNVLENEKFKGRFPEDPMRSWHELSEAEQHKMLEKRVGDYSTKVYRKRHENQVMPKQATVCQRENSFYVDTVRNFRDRRYEYKGMHKQWKKKADDAAEKGDLVELDRCKKMVVLYDSLQLAHKCILNSFYGYVMRKGSRWYSMEMAGIVCLTGATIIQMARQVVEKIGRPLELDTDGIWCILPATFPENFSFQLKNGKSVHISYPCSMLNHLVHAKFTNHQYQDLVDAESFEYRKKSENSIFFEVDGPYRAMILPSSTEEDKLLKKRYAVFNDDGTLAELKGFEVKRRGELKLIKTFQSEIFKVFLEGGTLKECYQAVASVADRWLDVLHTRGADLDDEELIELISENRSMSKTLEEYGGQKSTSISTAKRLAEFLGDQMIKDKGLNCQFIISSKPAGIPVSDRAIPVVIFQTEMSVRKHYLRKWLRDPSLNDSDLDIRSIIDWHYYLERFGSVIQKLITIPAAMQKVENPVPRVKHPDWLAKRVTAKEDLVKQRRITDMFGRPSNQAGDGAEDVDMDDADEGAAAGGGSLDMEDIAGGGSQAAKAASRLMPALARVTKMASQQGKDSQAPPPAVDLGPVPDINEDYGEWLEYQKKKWKQQRAERDHRRRLYGKVSGGPGSRQVFGGGANAGRMSKFIKRQAETLLRYPWQVLHIAETDVPGEYRLWALVDRNLHSIKVNIPRVFYVNSRIPYPEEKLNDQKKYTVTRCVRTLPRSHKCEYLYEFVMPESVYRENAKLISSFVSHPSIEGVYEMQVPLLYRALVSLGATVLVDSSQRATYLKDGMEKGFQLNHLRRDASSKPYANLIRDTRNFLNFMFLYHAGTETRHIFALLSTVSNRCHIFVVDRTNQMPNVGKMYTDVRNRAAAGGDDSPPATQAPQSEAFPYFESLDVRTNMFATMRDACRAIQKDVVEYQQGRHGPTVVLIQSPRSQRELLEHIPAIHEFPNLSIPSHRKDSDFPALDWQRYAAKRMVGHFLNVDRWLRERLALARYADVPFCNIESDFPVFLSDLFYARKLRNNDMLLWLSLSDRPDLGGREADENFYFSEELQNPEINEPGAYGNICVQLDIANLAVSSLLRSNLINVLEGSTGAVGFDAVSASLDAHVKTGREEEDPSAEAQAALDLSSTSADAQAISPQHFLLLKSMVLEWSSDVFRTQSKFADMMLQNVFRWLTSSSAKLYDPALYALVQGLMRKVFAQLIGEFKRLGSQIVFGSFEKLVVVTSKPALEDAVQYLRFLLRNILAKPLFELLEVVPTAYYENLLWMDVANYGGMLRRFPDPAQIAPEDLRPPPAAAADMHWNIKEYLPPAVQKQFTNLVAEFVIELFKRKLRWAKKGLSQQIRERAAVAAEQELDKENHLQGAPTADGRVLGDVEEEDETADTEVRARRQYVSSVIAPKLMQLVADIEKNVNPAANTADSEEDRRAASFPRLPGSHLDLTNPALEFAKTVCAALALDTSIEKQVRVLKKNALKLINVAEFAPEARWENPCETVRLPRVICDYCNSCRDLDLCRDPAFMPDPGSSAPAPWKCASCDAEYDKRVIEEALVDIVARRIAGWQMQDLVCRKCRTVKGDNLSTVCERCGNELCCTQSREDVIRKTRVLANIAELKRFELLQIVANSVLSKLG
ncbi:putative POL2-DNA polymerase epsilon, calytic subunit A [Hyaloraphidium curvatum]|nr:putative POL2-DNA polymerase epsilon, calytic subunit A [Hyaloraphidium curvatum]